MSTDLLTRCPNCSVTFKLTPAQLQAAKGAVRCGACLQVFHADNYLITAEEAELEPYNAASKKTGHSPTRSDLFDAFQSAREEIANTHDHSKTPPKPEFDDPFDQAINPSDAKGFRDGDDWADGLLSDIDSENKFDAPAMEAEDDQAYTEKEPAIQAWGGMPYEDDKPIGSSPEGGHEDELFDDGPDLTSSSYDFDTALQTEDLSDLSFGRIEQDSLDSVTKNHDAFGVIEENSEFGLSNADESWARDMLAELEQDTPEDKKPLDVVQKPAPEELTKSAKSTFDSVDSNAIKWAPPQDTDEGDEGFGPLDIEEIEAVDVNSPSKNSSAEKKDGFLNAMEADRADNSNELIKGIPEDLFSEIPDAGVHHNIHKSQVVAQSNGSRTGLWAALSLLAAAVFTTQFIGFNHQVFAQNASIRPLMEKVCNLGLCQLPARQNIDQIEGGSMVVRTHPDRLNTLIIDTVVHNRASFDQAFPLLELRFRDINGLTVAKRVFSPEEYKHGDLENMPLMPASTPIQFSLEIIDPGAEAVNYDLKFLPSNAPQA